MASQILGKPMDRFVCPGAVYHGAWLWHGGGDVHRAKKRGRIRVPASVCFAQVSSDFHIVGCRRGALKASHR